MIRSLHPHARMMLALPVTTVPHGTLPQGTKRSTERLCAKPSTGLVAACWAGIVRHKHRHQRHSKMDADPIADPANHDVWAAWEWNDWGLRYVRRRHLEPVPPGFAEDPVAVKRFALTKRLEQMIAERCEENEENEENEKRERENKNERENERERKRRKEGCESEKNEKKNEKNEKMWNKTKLFEQLGLVLAQLAGNKWASHVTWHCEVPTFKKVQ